MGERATINFEADVHRALCEKAAATDRSLSDVVNEAVKQALAEDAEDIHAIEMRRNEPSHGLEKLVERLKRRSKL
jgi:hypothetical protein